MYDIFFAIYDIESLKSLIKRRFPLAKFCILNENIAIQDALYDAQRRSMTKMFWFIDFEHEINDNFDINYEVPEWDQKYVHVFKDNESNYGGAFLIPKSYHITKKEADHLFFINKKEIDIIASYKKSIDIFFAVFDVEEEKMEILSRFPLAKFCILNENIAIQDALYDAQSRSSTEMFWFVGIGYEVKDNFDINYEVPIWDQKYVHVFKDNESNYGGAFLIPKSYHITKKEADHLFFINKKEIDIIASNKKYPDIFFVIYDAEETKEHLRSRFPRAKFCIIDKNHTIQDALYEAHSRSSTEMFWFVGIGYEVKDNFDINYEVPEWDQKYVHVFKEETTDNYGGAFLIPKSYHITKKEADHLFFINKKEIDIIASYKKSIDIFFAVFDVEEEQSEILSRFPLAKFCIIDKNHTIQDALYEAQSRSSTEMFWFVHIDYYVVDNFNFNFDVPKWDQKYVHVFKNDKDNYGGAFLIPKLYHITKKEAEHLFFINKKEIDVYLN